MKRILILTALVVALQAKAQKKDDLLAYQVPYFTWGKGLGITSPDSAFLMNIRFRLQNRIGITTISGSDFSVNEVEARVRRLRLR
ncbi:MAG: porin, partial [Cyclobacteriaceae bacterium]